ncbi:serine protease inhibitor Cvsi-2-like [Ruditapes philippinarum]|uniref:serine protease inhibitor Cvsi-2-like n=1 Tax=Ruditapes philippinarum TaxID=129788 RepID=UPI00295B79F5|nr:serine protease inhibitor Cvsi-2-like [Ruditapes philippinarum]
MRVLLLAVLVALTVYVSGEPCTTTQQCINHGITTCGGGSHVVCHNHQCECLTNSQGNTCTDVSDCHCDHGHPHCIDRHCRCTRF